MKQLIIIIGTIAAIILSGCRKTYIDNKGRKYYLNTVCTSGHNTYHLVPVYNPLSHITTFRTQTTYNCTSKRIDTIYLGNK